MLFIFSIIALIFFTAERIDPARTQPVFRRGIFTDGIYTVTSILVRVLVNGYLFVMISQLGETFFPAYLIGVLSGQPILVQSVAIIVLLDMFFYVMHRLKHRWQWWWRLHETHHSSQDLDWFSSVRFHPLEKVLDRTIYLLPLLFLGASKEALLVLATVDAMVASFSHSNLNWRIGPFIYIFVGPEMHRWHHSSDPKRRECNYGNNLSIFDWMFGTAYLTQENPTSFGLDDSRYPEGNMIKQFIYAFRPIPSPEKDESQSREIKTGKSH